MWPDADSLDFASAGCKGILDIKAVLSGKWGMIYAEHHPVLGMYFQQYSEISKMIVVIPNCILI